MLDGLLPFVKTWLMVTIVRSGDGFGSLQQGVVGYGLWYGVLILVENRYVNALKDTRPCLCFKLG